MEEFLLKLTIQAPALLFAIVIHEWAHAYVADRFGDSTPRMMGRLTLDPTAHIDIFGTIIFPLIGAMIGGVMFGWAKPVPVNPRFFRDIRKGLFWVSFAGPLSNIIMSVLSAFLYVLFLTKVPVTFGLRDSFMQIFEASIYINMVLAVFNLIPFPPLDGSKMVSSYLSYTAASKFEELQKFGFVFFLILMFTNILSYLLMPAFLAVSYLKSFFHMILI